MVAEPARWASSPLPVTAPRGLPPFAWWAAAAPGRVGVMFSAQARYAIAAGRLAPLGEAAPLWMSPLRLEGASRAAGEASVLAEPATTPAKERLDVAVLGCSYPPTPRARRWPARVAVGRQRATFDVHQPRRWARSRRGELAAAPAGRLERIPMCYEYAFGGEDPAPAEGRDAAFGPNPVGLGYATTEAWAEGSPLPCIEDPRAPIHSWTCRPAPQATCFTPASSTLRSRYLAPRALRAAIAAGRRPPLAAVHPRFFNRAHPRLQLQPARPGAEVRAQGFRPGGAALRFRLPPLRLGAHVAWSDGWSEHSMRLDTLLLDAEAERVELTWRGWAPCAGHELGRLEGVSLSCL